MERKIMTVFALLLCFLAPSVSAECLTVDQQDALISMALANNQSPSFLVDIFNSFCDRSYSRNDTDTKIESFREEITTDTENQINNYTAWVEEQLEIKSYMEDMVTIINASMVIKNFDDRMERNQVAVFDQLDDQIQNFKKDYAEKEWVSSQLASYSFRAENDQQTQFGWEIYIAIFAVLGVLIYLYFDWNKKRLPPMRAVPEDRQQLKSHSFNLPGMQELKGRVLNEQPEQPASAGDGVRGRKGKGPAKI